MAPRPCPARHHIAAAACAKRTCSATAARVSIGSTGCRVRHWRPRPVPAPRRRRCRPVNEPGPDQRPGVELAQFEPGLVQQTAHGGDEGGRGLGPPGSLCAYARSPHCTAMDRVSVLVSKARRFMAKPEWEGAPGACNTRRIPALCRSAVRERDGRPSVDYPGRGDRPAG